MAIYRGAGGASDSVDDATVNAVAASAASAASSAAAAAGSASSAAASAASASGSVASVTTSASNAATSASQAATSASNAATSATSASNDAAAANASALAASTSASNASNSASAAGISETNAASSASNASTSATSSANSAASALAIYGNTTAMNNAVAAASTSASNAATSASNAAASAATATTQATNASNSAVASEASKNTAVISSYNAGVSAYNAAVSATAASTSATNSAAVYGGLSAVNAAVATTTTNANNAATSATNAATSATQAAASAASASAIVLGTASSLPSIRPTLNLDFANSSVIDPRITFTRASTGTYYDGKTTAKAEENLVIQSQAYSGGLWSTNLMGTITDNSTTAPDGTATGASISNGISLGTHGLYKTVSSSIGSTLSIYAKAGTSQYVGINPTISTSCYAVFDLTGGTVTASVGCTASIVSVGNGWYRCIVANTTVAGLYFIIDPVLTSTTAPYSPYTATNQQVYIWGAQLEQRSSVTAYTPTTTQAITNYIPVLQTAASGVARLDHDPVTFAAKGLLIEEARTNLLTYSSAFDNPAWTKGSITITSSSVIAPDGTQSAQVVVPNNGTTVGAATPLYRIVTAATGSYTLSIYAKAKEFVSFVLQDGSGNGGFFNLSTLVSTNIGSGVGSFAPVGNGWYRCVVVLASATNPYFFFYPTTGTGDGVSGIYIWGAQLEAGAFATSYIPTTTAQATRAADSASMTGTNFSSWYSTGEGTILTEASQPTIFSSSRTATSVNDNALNRFNIYRQAAGGINGFVTPGSGAIASGITATANTVWKGALAHNNTTGYFSVNGSAVVSGAHTIPLGSLNNLCIGNVAVVGSEHWNGYIRKLSYYPKRLTNTELQALTA